MTINEKLKQQRQQGVLIAAHRGTYGGNIIFNTIPAYENALRHKADIIELDAAMTTDGVFYCFHDTYEPLLLGTVRNIRTMSSDYVDQLFLRTVSLELTKERVNRLEDALEHLRGRCLINIDRAWFYWREIIALIRKMGMEDQIILKSPAASEYLDCLQDAADIAYMPIAKTTEQAMLAADYKINWPMVELVFKSIDDEIVSDAFIAKLKSRGLLLWVNVITLNDHTVLSGGRDDRNAIMQNPDDNWGWCIRKGFDALQTDWPLLLRDYIAHLT